MSVFDTAKKVVVGDVAHDAADSGNPISVGGRASTNAPTAVAVSDRVRAWFDLNGRLVTNVELGPSAHNAADTGNPVKIGGKVSTTTPAAVAHSSRTDAWFDANGRLNVVASAVRAYSLLELVPATPVPTGSDILSDAGSAIASTDLTIRDDTEHWFWLPMGVSGYRSLVITVGNDATPWDVVPTYKVFSGFGQVSNKKGAQLAAFTGIVGAGQRLSIGTSTVGQGGLLGTDPTPGQYYYYPVPAISDGHAYLAFVVKFASAPSTGALARLTFMRMAF